jgi:hypothetical protein
MLKHLTTPSPPPIANISPALLKSVVKTALLKSVIVAHGLYPFSSVSKILASFEPAPPATIISPVLFKN